MVSYFSPTKRAVVRPFSGCNDGGEETIIHVAVGLTVEDEMISVGHGLAWAYPAACGFRDQNTHVIVAALYRSYVAG